MRQIFWILNWKRQDRMDVAENTKLNNSLLFERNFPRVNQLFSYYCISSPLTRMNVIYNLEGNNIYTIRFVLVKIVDYVH